ncbi:MAG: hypothetical protein ABIG34_05385 [Candidatus Peregrinibacteria bacterium]
MVSALLFSALLLPLSLSVQIVEQPAASVPTGAQRVEMIVLNLSASCSGGVAMHGVTVTHRGLGAIRDISSVYAMSDGVRVSRARALSSRDGTVTLTFRPAVVVPACGVRHLSIMANFSADASRAGEHRITLSGPGDIDAQNASVSLTSASRAPVRRTVGVNQGSVDVAFLPLLSRVRYGTHRTVARLRLTAEEYDQAIDALTLTNDGSARAADLQNLTLETSRGEVLARLSSLEDDRAPFVFSTPFIMKRGQMFLLTVRADVLASRRRTIGFMLEEPSDLVTRRSSRRR